jgi:site-specific DNA recombinase
MLMKNEVASIKELASREGISVRYICRLLPLAKLAPDIVENILDGYQHPSLTVNVLRELAPANWSKQHQTLAAQSYN